MPQPRISYQGMMLHIASLITTEHVIPAKAGIQENTGFRVKPGMTNWIRLMSLCIGFLRFERSGRLDNYFTPAHFCPDVKDFVGAVLTQSEGGPLSRTVPGWLPDCVGDGEA